MTRIKIYIGAFMALLLALAMMPMVAFADGHKLEIVGAANDHDYQVYQLLIGTVDINDLDNGAAPVGDVQRGESLKDGVTAQDVLKVVEDNPSEAERAQKLYDLINLSNPVAKLTSVTYYNDDLPDGYYLIIDEAADIADGDAASRFIVAVSGNTEIRPKKDAPTLDKKIINDKAPNVPWANGTVNSAAIGDVVKYQLTSRVPDMTGYASYSFVIHDTLSAGLTLLNDDANKILITIGSKEFKASDFKLDAQSNSLTITLGDAEGDFKAFIDNYEGLKYGDSITVTYNALVNENASIGNIANENEAYISYSNNPNTGGIGKTKDDKTYTYVTKLVIYKTGENGILPGVEFSLKHLGSEKELKGTVGDDGYLTFDGIAAGDYELTETHAPDGYNKIDPMKFTLIAPATNEGVWTGSGIDYVVMLGDEGEEQVAINGFYLPIQNHKGLLLPSTGGIGTVIFTVVGAIVIIGAVAFLVMRRRRSDSE